MNAKTSDRVSSIAARYMNMTGPTLMALTAKSSTAEITADEIRSMAASLMRQDEVKGIRKIIRKITG